MTNSSWSLYISPFDDPYVNHAWENILLEEAGKGGGPSLFLYRNRPTIVLGRFQVPWREVNFSQAKSLKTPITFLRRRSGGGTVYHDLGNWNLCFVRPGRDLKREENLDWIIKVLADKNVALHRNDRFDLVVDGPGLDGPGLDGPGLDGPGLDGPGLDGPFKVSGSAFKQKKEAHLHHCTLLVEADLKALKGVLGQSPDIKLTGKGILSVPSPVINLKERGLSFSFPDWVKAWSQELEAEAFSLKDLDASFKERLEVERKSLWGWEWLWGESPKFTVEFRHPDSELLIECVKGRMTEHSQGLPAPFIGLPLASMDLSQWQGLEKANPDVFSQEEMSSIKDFLLRPELLFC